MSKFIRLGGSNDSYSSENKQPLQQNLTQDEIDEYLKDYLKLSSKNLFEKVKEIPLNTHLRYYSVKENGEKLFRLGGFLKKVDPNGRYIILANKDNKSWSVNLEKSVLYKKITSTDYFNLLHDFNVLKDYLTKNKNIQKNP